MKGTTVFVVLLAMRQFRWKEIWRFQVVCFVFVASDLRTLLDFIEPECFDRYKIVYTQRSARLPITAPFCCRVRIRLPRTKKTILQGSRRSVCSALFQILRR